MGRLWFELGLNLILKILTSTGYFSSSMLCNLLVNHLLLSLYIIYISYITSNIHMIFKIKQYFHYRSVLHTNDINKWNFRTEILMWIKPMKGFCWYLMAMKVVLIILAIVSQCANWKHLEESERVITASKDKTKSTSVRFDHCQVLTQRARLLFVTRKEITSWCSGPDG